MTVNKSSTAAGEISGKIKAESGTCTAATGKAVTELPFALLHDLNQPLTAIGNYAQVGRQLLEKGQVDFAQLGMLFEKILAQSARAAHLSQSLKAAMISAPEKPE